MLVNCPECGRQISDQAPACPGCGFVLTPAVPKAAPPPPTSPYASMPSYHDPASGKHGSGGGRTALTVVGVIGGLFLLLVLVGTLGGASSSSDSSAANSEAAPTAPAATTAASASRSAAVADSSAPNLSDARALDDKYSTPAVAACGAYADDYIKDQVHYDYKWDPDASGFFGVRFEKFRNSVDQPGVLTLVSDRLLIQNPYGAYERSMITCRYNTQTEKVLGFELIQP